MPLLTADDPDDLDTDTLDELLEEQKEAQAVVSEKRRRLRKVSQEASTANARNEMGDLRRLFDEAEEAEAELAEAEEAAEAAEEAVREHVANVVAPELLERVAETEEEARERFREIAGLVEEPAEKGGAALDKLVSIRGRMEALEGQVPHNSDVRARLRSARKGVLRDLDTEEELGREIIHLAASAADSDENR